VEGRQARGPGGEASGRRPQGLEAQHGVPGRHGREQVRELVRHLDDCTGRGVDGRRDLERGGGGGGDPGGRAGVASHFFAARAACFWSKVVSRWSVVLRNASLALPGPSTWLLCAALGGVGTQTGAFLSDQGRSEGIGGAGVYVFGGATYRR
jgi:hypothetical protein